ncbi:HIT family protein [Corynebacterium cystitidis]|uniref:Diadenosine tetraphosphate (Ap4A) hydrolase n=1 Tax=Corynebacterium cystitidis DSM 20524 TaxID=1121357 RepID=A0A1H9PBN2_9CORY|nr:AP-4-A phosphorylase [Corynebacterium cystitidis DSM 20524]SER45654.1 Diadenosine tetraphosphate (Ap4A) hydrolase [Corynebacterium cystitidis DSM 20524]SNV73486.1 HIT family protein [Corynebacterium cystitidis]
MINPARKRLPRDVHNNAEKPAAYIDTGVGEEDRLQRLWAPYRAAYIADVPQKDEERGPFVVAAEMDDEEALIVARGSSVYALLNLYPYNSGHLMVVPYRKVANLEDLTDEETAELMEFAKLAVRTLKRVSHPESINVGLNLGRSAGGSVGDHLHLHIVPRWTGDSNFMTVLGETKVFPELLRDTRKLLAEAWSELVDDDRLAAQEKGRDNA